MTILNCVVQIRYRKRKNIVESARDKPKSLRDSNFENLLAAPRHSSAIPEMIAVKLGQLSVAILLNVSVNLPAIILGKVPAANFDKKCVTGTVVSREEKNFYQL